jgi:predicted lipoprotein
VAGNVRIKWDKNAVKKVVDNATKDLTQTLQLALDAVHRELSGQPVETIKPRLASVWRSKAGKPLIDPELTEWATAISHGDRITLRAGKVR